MTETTRAFRVHGFDRPPVLEQIALPAPGAGELRVRIRAAALNFADTLMCLGTYQDTPEPPFTLGLELAGDVEACGAGVTGLPPGTRVAVFSGQGGLAEAGNFPAERCVPIPDALGYDAAAALQIAYGTSHMALGYKARLQPGERLVVTGAAGGVGLTAVEIGRIMGAEVIAIARGEDRLAIAREAGADHVIDATAPGIRDRIRALGGADVVYDAVGGALYEDCFRATNPDGRILLIGFAGGNLPVMKPNHMLVKNITAIGFYWGGYMRFNPAPLRASLATLFDWAAAGRIRPHVSRRLPLTQAGEALDVLRSRRAAGKIVVTP
ncbi:NADPH:quinone oxidoreductase family protein [Celeribacter indicus]|uniref:Putative alcohol dehydrogenase n=1 Tax=Celeribacter indicus TaxID=1208324 RepID=A0A0B5DRT4_9RHOB|nr:NADPH:quinone oxidoreductase family protein [Celeribacter indicus]AJE46238.1 putative alcohol dehydrogenase [Celeribacter indicus]SDW50785.1 NADPH2:quinone reductase [Celeribacter indicus]